MMLTPFEVAILSVDSFGAYQKEPEFGTLLALVEQREPKVVVEIGSGQGGSAWAWSKVGSVRKLICIDKPDGNWGGAGEDRIKSTLQYVANHAPWVKVSLLTGNSQSQSCLSSLESLLDGDGIDFLFIDGDHSYEGVKTDFLTYSPLVNKPGLIAFHDICEHAVETGCEVKRFWDEVKESGIPAEDYSEFISEPLHWGGIGVIQW